MSAQAAATAGFYAEHAPDDTKIVGELLAQIEFRPEMNAAIDRRATRYIEFIRKAGTGIGGVEDFLREYGLSTREGLALMVLAEALLRVPDAATQDKLIEDKLKQGGWATMKARAARCLSPPRPGRWDCRRKSSSRAKRRKASSGS